MSHGPMWVHIRQTPAPFGDIRFISSRDLKVHFARIHSTYVRALEDRQVYA